MTRNLNIGYRKEIDFLFIDTIHNATQLNQELAIHAPIVSNYIAIHDTQLFKDHYSNAIEKFVELGEWEIELELKDSPGLTILKRRK